MNHRDRRLQRIKRRLIRSDPTCFYCGSDLRSRQWETLDHLIPSTAGGTDATANLVLACWRCNQR